MADKSYHVSVTRPGYLNSSTRKKLEDRYTREKIRQRGIEFPSPTKQEHMFIVRFDIMDSLSLNRDRDRALVRYGLRDLCKLFDKLDNGIKKIDNLSEDGDINPVSLSEFNFSFTIGFGLRFFEKLNIIEKNRPRNLTEMPIHSELGDTTPYSLPQTDFIVQLGADDDYVNRWVFQNRTGIIRKKQGHQGDAYHKQDTLKHDDEDIPDIYTATSNWAKIIDINAGFQRIDGRNLLGFNDGISNPIRFSNNAIWTTRQDENEKFQNGTYMVFQKIEHDLERWQKMDEEKQELWIGRSKGTGLLLGTLSKTEDRKLAADLHSNNNSVRQAAKKKWQRLYDQQKDPERRFFDPTQRHFKGIQVECPVWSHVRKANPRQADGAVKSLIFRRGYLFIDGGADGTFNSGLLFICFQRNIKNAFENIKKNFLNNKNFPVPQLRKNFNSIEAKQRLQQASLPNGAHGSLSYNPDTQNTGKEGLSGPSELGVFPGGLPPVTITLGGGYYFIPPIPNKKISDISEQFFD
jgi:Dyp-type peroxidase family